MGESAEGAGLGLPGAMLVDDGPQLGIALEGGAADAGELGDGDQHDVMAGVHQLAEGAFNADGRGLGHAPAAWAMTASRRAILKSFASSAVGASPLCATATTSSRNPLGYGFGMVGILPARPLSMAKLWSPLVAMKSPHPRGVS